MKSLEHSLTEELVDEIAREISTYLARNPEAGDSLEGITRWWLKSQRIEVEARRVMFALERLCDQGLVEKRRGPSGQVLYSQAKRGMPGK